MTGAEGLGAGALVDLINRWVRRVQAAERGPGVGEPGVDGWLAAELPCSFVYGGRSSAEVLSEWLHQIEVNEVSGGRTVHRVRRVDPASGLEMAWEATTYANHPAVEWIVRFRNTGATKTHILERVRALDLVLVTDYHDLVVYHATGGHPTPDAFQPHQTALSRSEPFRLASVGGR